MNTILQNKDLQSRLIESGPHFNCRLTDLHLSFFLLINMTINVFSYANSRSRFVENIDVIRNFPLESLFPSAPPSLSYGNDWSICLSKSGEKG